MVKVIFKLRKEHVNFKKLLDLLDAQLDLLHRGEEPDYQLMTDILYYMTEYSDTSHHPKEEAIFSLLLERDSTVAENVAEITRQHHTIGESGARLHEKLENIISGECEIMQLKELETPGRLYITTLRTHMEEEDKNLFVLAEQLLNNDDWKKINVKTQPKSDPLFGTNVDERFFSLCRQLGQAACKNTHGNK
jgi:hemerythrin-like domain-containing protein